MLTCRSFLQAWKDEQGNEVNAGRMNLGVVTLNLPRIALESDGDFDLFWSLFNERLAIVHTALKFRINRCLEALPENAPILYKHGAFGARLKDSDSVASLFLNKRATVSIGYTGIYETVTKMFNNNAWETDPEAYAFSLDLVKQMKDYSTQWSEEDDVWYSVYSTPSESLTDRFCRLDTARFGVIPDVTDKEYYNNSFHYDVRKTVNPFEKMDFEAPYPHYASGGFIHYVEAVIPKHNLKALESLWDYSYDKLGYFGVNTPIDRCYKCGFEGEFKATDNGYVCPDCGNDDPNSCDVIKRMCGYLGQPQLRPCVHGRQEEIKHRVKHTKGE